MIKQKKKEYAKQNKVSFLNQDSQRVVTPVNLDFQETDKLNFDYKKALSLRYDSKSRIALYDSVKLNETSMKSIPEWTPFQHYEKEEYSPIQRKEKDFLILSRRINRRRLSEILKQDASQTHSLSSIR